MFSWLGFSTDPQQQQQEQKIEKEEVEQTKKYVQNQFLYKGEKSNMISSKVAPSVKATSVNVIIDDVYTNNDSAIIYSEPETMSPTTEPIRSASISLSIELAKKSSMSSLSSKSKPIPLMQKPDNITPHSSLPKSMMIQKQPPHRSTASIASSSSNSLLQRMAHSPKASAAAFPTSVSANGNVIYDNDNNKYDEHETSTIRSAAIQSLSKKVDTYTPIPTPTVQSDEEEEDDNEHKTPTQGVNNTTSSIESKEDNNTDNFNQQLDNQLNTLKQASEDINENNSKQQKTTEVINSPPPSTCENTIVQKQADEARGFWSWLGFSYSTSENDATTSTKELRGNSTSLENDKDNLNITTVTSNNTTATDVTVTDLPSLEETPSTKTLTTTENTKTSSSWTSYLFPSKPAPIQETKVETQPSAPPIQKHDSSIDIKSIESNNSKPIMKEIKVLQKEEAADVNLRKVKSASSLPTPVAINGSPDLRLSSSTSSIRPRKKNVVLPLFDSQFTPTETSEVVPPVISNNSNMLTKAIDAINSILIQPPPDQPEDTSNWLAKRMREKFSSFVEDMKSSDPKTIVDKRIVVVGVHGWFPMKLVRSMIGEPTGTSIKFCEQMAASVKLYFKTEHGVTLSDNAITMVPLEGEGKVEDRVNQLYSKLVDNSVWLEAVSSADVILWATHSQGTPVSIMLLQRLLERGHVHIIRQSVCLLAMAGISHGPFPALKGSLIVKYFEADAARELFEFMDSHSSISQKFHQSLKYVLKCGLKVVLTGSMQDQVVPLYSAIMSAVNHPSILRSIYIDGHVYSQDDFLINLIIFALTLRNTGLPDYDLLVHLSEVLAGSLYALEGGHSTIYEEVEVYMTAVKYTFETAPFGKYVRAFPSSKNESPPVSKRKKTPPISRKTSISTSSLLMTAMAAATPAAAEIEDAKIESFQAKQQQNPFYLPWALHGICSDPMILADEVLKKDLTRLLSLFEQWNPTSSRLKELKYRLDPLRTIKLS